MFSYENAKYIEYFVGYLVEYDQIPKVKSFRKFSDCREFSSILSADMI